MMMMAINFSKYILSVVYLYIHKEGEKEGEAETASEQAKERERDKERTKKINWIFFFKIGILHQKEDHTYYKNTKASKGLNVNNK